VNSAPYDVLSEYPESIGLAWNHNYETKETGSDPQAHVQLSKVTHADGSYLEKWVQTQGNYTDRRKSLVRSNGTAEFTERYDSTLSKITVGLPFPNGSQYVIPVDANHKKSDVPDWYPGGQAPPAPLSNFQVQIVSFAKTPDTCGTQAKQKAYDIRLIGGGLDPLGSYFTETYDAFDSPTLGMICSIEANVSAGYDVATGASTGTVTITSVSVLTAAGRTNAGTRGLAPIRPPAGMERVGWPLRAFGVR